MICGEVSLAFVHFLSQKTDVCVTSDLLEIMTCNQNADGMLKMQRSIGL